MYMTDEFKEEGSNMATDGPSKKTRFHRSEVEALLTPSAINAIKDIALELAKKKGFTNHYHLAFTALEIYLRARHIFPGFTVKQEKGAGYV